jgi:DNA mismatch repair protein MutS2
LIDEFGTGTDPELGGAVAEAMLEDLSRRRTLGVITTHYMNIKLAADRLDGVRNACMLFDDDTLQPLYQLVIGQPGSSYTYIIAEKIGLPVALINRARNMTSKDKVTLDRMLQQLQKEQQELRKLLQVVDEKQTVADKSKAKFEELQDKMKHKLERTSANHEETSKAAKGRARKALSEMKKVIASYNKASVAEAKAK